MYSPEFCSSDGGHVGMAGIPASGGDQNGATGKGITSIKKMADTGPSMGWVGKEQQYKCFWPQDKIKDI